MFVREVHAYSDHKHNKNTSTGLFERDINSGFEVLTFVDWKQSKYHDHFYTAFVALGRDVEPVLLWFFKE